VPNKHESNLKEEKKVAEKDDKEEPKEPGKPTKSVNPM
jgi:hypothetical protein